MTASTCPHCGADWSGAFRVRRKTKTREFSWRITSAYAAAGALVAILLAALVNSIVGAIALHSLPPGAEGLPAGFMARLGLALTGIGQALANIVSHTERLGAGALAGLVIVVIGAAGGAMVYMYKAGALRVRVPSVGPNSHKRRRRASNH